VEQGENPVKRKKEKSKIKNVNFIRKGENHLLRTVKLLFTDSERKYREGKVKRAWL